MRTCRECENRLVGGHPIESNAPPGTMTYEYECGHCGHWWMEDEPIDRDWRPKRLQKMVPSQAPTCKTACEVCGVKFDGSNHVDNPLMPFCDPCCRNIVTSLEEPDEKS
jgi:hypothetical protein